MAEIEPSKKPNKLKRILKFVFNSAIVRGVVKSLPFGNVVYEVGENIAKEVKTDVIAIEAKQPHNWFSITIQILCLGTIVYAFVTKQITVQEVIDLLNSLIPD